MDVTKQPNIKGSCLFMCPSSEATFREKEKLLHPFEVKAGTVNQKNAKVDRDIAVKEYSRSAAGKELTIPENIRSTLVLVKTVDYLMNNISVRRDVPWTEVYSFMFNRLRSVRQDLAVQDVHDASAVDILEKITRFHLYAGYRLCEKNAKSAFDASINHTHLLDCLKQLLRLYEDSPPPHESQQHWPNRCEFESYYLLYNLGKSEALHHFLQLPAKLRSSECLHIAWLASMCFLEHNHVRLFRLASKQFSGLQGCAFHRHARQLCKASIRIRNAAYSSKQCKYPVSTLRRLLCIDRDESLVQLANACGIPCVDGHLVFQAASWRDSTEMPPVPLSFIDVKLADSQLSSLLSCGDIRTSS